MPNITKKACRSGSVEDRTYKMKTRATNATNVVNYYPTGMTVTRGERIANQRRSARLKERRRQERRHQRHLDEGISPGEFQRLPKLQLTAINKKDLREKSCAICQSIFRKGQHLIIGSPCRHPFHSKCMEKWLKQTPNCPYCRACQPCELEKKSK